MAAASDSTDVLIVIPTLGERPDFLQSTIKSIRKQDVPCSLVMVGPADSPALKTIAAAWEIDVLPDPGSLPGAINLGVSAGLTDHDFVTWLNDDDFLEPGSLRTTVNALRAQPDAVLAYGACRYVDGEDRELWVSRAGRWAQPILGWGPDLIPQPGMLVRSWAWQQVGGLDVTFGLAFDLDLLLRIRKLGPLIDTGDILANFRWHRDSLTVDNRRQNFAESERAKRSALPSSLKPFAPVWELPVRWATRAAVWEVNRRARSRLRE